MIIHDLDVFSPCVRPTEAKAELIVNTDAVLACAVSFQGFQSISRRNSQIVELARDLHLPQLASCHGRDIHKKRLTRDPLASASVSAHLNVLITGINSNVPRDYWSRLDVQQSKAASASMAGTVRFKTQRLCTSPTGRRRGT